MTDVLMKDGPAPIPDIAAACEAQTRVSDFLMLLPHINSEIRISPKEFFFGGSPIAIASPSLIFPHLRIISSRRLDKTSLFHDNVFAREL